MTAVTNTQGRGTVILGLDGATWKILKPFAERGVMPSLARIMERSAYGQLVSTDPPITGAAWLAIATGLNPGKTGVIDFFVRTSPDTFELRFVNSNDFRGRSYWDLIEAMGGSAGVAFYPTLYPPYPLRGFMISGFGAPSDRLYTWPQKLANKLMKIVPDFNPIVEPRNPKYSDLEKFIEDTRKHLDNVKGIAQYLVKRYRVLDNLTFVVSATDWIQHRAWHVLHEHPLKHKLNEEVHKKAIEELYMQIDDIISFFYEYAIAEEKIFITISDHGFQHHSGVFNLAEWFRKKRLIRVHRMKFWRYKILDKAKSLAKRLGVAEFLRKKIPKTVENSLRTKNIDLIDYTASMVVLLEHSMLFGAVYVAEGKDREEALRIIKEALSEAEEKYGVNFAAYRREELYHGPMLDLLPDLIIISNNYHTAIAHTFRYPLYIDKPLDRQYTGIHDKEGIILISGDGVKHGKEMRTSIYDVMPTILFIHGLPIPSDVDGKPLTSAFIEPREPQYVERKYYNARLRVLARLRKLQ